MARILVVDDEQLIVDMLTAFLELLGHESIEAFSSNQARDRLAYADPDVILLDIQLPDMDGITLCRELRSVPATAELPIIVISAYAPPKIEEALKAGANGYLAKPIDLTKLRSALDSVNISSP
jgi:CheY-like chemotaxis protein